MLRSERAGRSSRKSYGGPGKFPMAGAMTVLLERWFRSGCLTQRRERGFVLQQRGALVAPSARSGSLNDVDGGPDGGGYIHIGGIEQVRILRLF
jgi:hypothetical protein